MCVAQLWKKSRKGFSRLSRSQEIAPSSVSLVPEDVRLGHLLEEVVRVEDERPDLVAVRGERAEERLRGGVELRVPVQVAVVVRVQARDHRGHRRRRPRRGADGLVEANPAGCELVDRLRVDEARAVAAEMIGAQRVGDVDDDVHERGPVY